MILIVVAGFFVCAVIAVLAFLVARAHMNSSQTGTGGINPGLPSVPTGSSSSGVGTSPTGPFPSKIFAPYWDTSSESTKWQDCPAKYIMLGFVLSSDSSPGTPVWNQGDPLSSKLPLINRMRQAGKDVIVSFGGSTGKELATQTKDVDKLAAAYISVIDQLDLAWIDVDIEESTANDADATDRRNQALAKVQKARPHVTLSYTIGVMPDGLPSREQDLLKNAKDRGVRVDVVNIMTMDYSESHAKMEQGKLGVSAAVNTYKFMQSNGFGSSKLGLTPMIGVDDMRAVFDQAAAKTLRDFALSQPYVRMLSFWEISRDNARRSHVSQSDWEFSRIFATFK